MDKTESPTALQITASAIYHEVIDNADGDPNETFSLDYNSEDNIATITHNDNQVHVWTNKVDGAVVIYCQFQYEGHDGGLITFNYMVEQDSISMVVADLL